MSAESRAAGLAACSLLLGLCTTAMAADEELPDLDFLEYLGSWEESDEDWELFREFAGIAAPIGEESAPDVEVEESATETADDTAASESTES